MRTECVTAQFNGCLVGKIKGREKTALTHSSYHLYPIYAF